MALDKERILSELNSVMSQLQSADCGCMEKLFNNNGMNNSMVPMQKGCFNGGGGGCCRRSPCNFQPACMANSPMVNCPMANCPMVNAPMGNGPMPNGSVVNSPMANDQMGNYHMPNDSMGNYQMTNNSMGNYQMPNDPMSNSQMPNNQMANCEMAKSCMPYGNMNPKQMYNETFDYLNKNLMQPTMKEIYDDFRTMNPSNTVSNMPQGGASTVMANTGGNAMGNSGGAMDMPNSENMEMSKIGTGVMGMANMNPNMAEMGLGQENMTPGNMGSQIMKMMNMFGSGKPGKVPKLSIPEGGGVMMPNNMTETPNALQGHMGGEPMQAQGGAMSQQYGMHMGQADKAHITKGGMAHSGMGAPNMAHEGMVSANMMQGDNNMIPMIPGEEMSLSNMGTSPNVGHPKTDYSHVSPGQGNINTNTTNMNSGHIGYGNVAANNMKITGMPQRNMNAAQMGRGNNVAASMGDMSGGNPHRSRGMHGNANFNQGMNFNQMPGSGGNDQFDFDPMAIALQMNPANQKKAAVNMINKMMSGNNGLANYMNSFMGIQPPRQQAIAQLQSPGITSTSDTKTELNEPDLQQQQSAQVVTGMDSNVNPANENNTEAPPVSKYMTTGNTQAQQERQVMDPIYPAEVRGHHAPTRKHYELNALGQPVQYIPAENYHARTLPLPQTLAPQPVPMSDILNRAPNDEMRYSNVKSTVSKTSIPHRSTTRIPSRGQLYQSGYKGSQSDTVHNVRQPVQGGSHSDGRLNTTPKVQNTIPIESISKVAGDATSGHPQLNTVPEKIEESKGETGKTLSEVPQSFNKGRHDGLQDRSFPPCPNSSWSFGGPVRMPYEYAYVPPASTNRSNRRRR